MAEPGIVHLYAANLDVFKLSDLISADVRLALVTSAYAPNVSATGHDTWSDVSATQIAAGNGYTSGGFALTGESIAPSAANDGFKFSSGNAVWTASGAGIPAWRYGILYVNGSLWGRASPLLGYFLGDSAPADVPLTASGNPLTLYCPGDGWFKRAAG